MPFDGDAAEWDDSATPQPRRVHVARTLLLVLVICAPFWLMLAFLMWVVWSVVSR